MKSRLRKLRLRARSPNAPILLFIAFWLVSVFAIEAYRPTRDFDDSLYRALQLFAFSWSPIDGAPQDPGWLLRSCQLLAPLFTVVSVLTLVSKRFKDSVQLHLQRFNARRRIILLGFGAINRAFARKFSDGDWSVLAVERAFTEGDRAFAREHGILLLAGDVIDPAVLRKVYPHQAHKTLVATGEDAANVEVARLTAIEVNKQRASKPPTWLKQASRLQHALGTLLYRKRRSVPTLPEARVDLHLGSPGTMRALNNLKDKTFEMRSRVQAYSMRVEAARHLVRRARFAERAGDLGRDQVHVAIIGLGDLGEAVLTEILQTVVNPDIPPRLTLIDHNVREARNRIEGRYPRLFDHTLPSEARPEIDWEDLDALGIEGACTQRCQDFQTVTAWVFCCRDDAVNLGAAAQMENSMARLELPPVPIYARVWETPPLRERDGAVGPGTLLEAFGDITTSVASRVDQGEEVERIANANHQAYLNARAVVDQFEEDPDAFREDWEALPEAIKLSNRASARHVIEKLKMLGFDWRGRHRGVIPKLRSKLDICEELERLFPGDQTAPHKGFVLSPDLLLAARTEHARFMIERALSGWRAAKDQPRNDRRMIHNDIRPFESLQEETRLLDLHTLDVVRRTSWDNDAEPRPFARRFKLKVLELDKTDLGTLSGVTQIDVILPADKRKLDSKHRRLVEDALYKAGKHPDLTRVLIRVEGDNTLKLEGEVVIDGQAFNDVELSMWLAKLKKLLHEDMIFDVAYRAPEFVPGNLLAKGS